MRKLITLIACILFSHAWSYAQCPFDPTISPNNLILCPNETDTLWTQAADSYQWYKDGNLIVGANSQYLVVDYYYYAGTNITVAATTMGCSEVSPSVLVDGWAFLPPFVMHRGNYTYDGQSFNVCLNDTITFELGLPYNANIQWTKDAIPIAGSSNALIEITSSSTTGINSYGVCGSPSICPNYLQCVGVSLNVQFVTCNTAVIEEPSQRFAIYPNPSNSLVNIECSDKMIGAKYSIVNQLGSVLLVGTLSTENTVVDISNLPTGLYFVKVGDDNFLSQKLIKN